MKLYGWCCWFNHRTEKLSWQMCLFCVFLRTQIQEICWYTQRCAPRTFGSTNLSNLVISPWPNYTSRSALWLNHVVHIWAKYSPTNHRPRGSAQRPPPPPESPGLSSLRAGASTHALHLVAIVTPYPVPYRLLSASWSKDRHNMVH